MYSFGMMSVVPQNFPSHMSQDMSRIISKLFKMAQELGSHITSKGSQFKIRILCCIKVLASKWPQVLSNVLICSQVHPCQISSLVEEVWSVNCSRSPKCDCARAKVNCDLKIVKPQGFFVNILIFKYNSSFDQGLVMIHQGLLKIHQDSKVAKLGFCRKSQLNFDQE